MPKTAQIKAFNGLIGTAIIPKRLKAKRNKQPIMAFKRIPNTPFFLIFKSQHEKAITATPKIIEVIISITKTNILYYTWLVLKLE
jgi:hypothetical protein